MKCRSVSRARRFLAPRADPGHAADCGRVVWRRRCRNRLVCNVWIGARSHHQQKDSFFRSTPSTSRVLAGRQVNPSSRTDRPPVASRAGAFGPAARSYISRPTESSRPHSIASRSGSSLDRSSLRGPRDPSTCPAVRALGFIRSRDMFSGPVWWPPQTARPSRRVIATFPSWPRTGQYQASRRRRDLRWSRATYRRPETRRVPDGTRSDQRPCAPTASECEALQLSTMRAQLWRV